MSSNGSFVLHTALLSTIKACGASCGAVVSFWDPSGATLSSVEFLDFQPLTTPTTTTQHQHISVGVVAPQQHQDDPNKNKIEESPELTSSTSNNNNSITKDQNPIHHDEAILPEVPSSINNITAHQAKTQTVASLPPATTRTLSYSHRCVAIASTITSLLSSSTSRNQPQESNLAHVFAGDNNDGSSRKNQNHSNNFSSSSSSSHRHHHQQQIQFYTAAHNILANKAITPAVVQAVAKSGISVHCTSPSSPYLAVPILAKKTQVDAIYSSSSRRLLEFAGPGGALNHLVVVGMLVLVGFPVIDENADANALAVLEGLTSSLDESRKKNVLTTTAAASKIEHAVNVLAMKKVSFRAEEETIAVTLARTIFAEILSTPEGLIASEKSMGNYLVNSLSTFANSVMMTNSPSKINNINTKSSNFKRLAGAAKLTAKLSLSSSKKSSTNNEANPISSSMTNEKNVTDNHNYNNNNTSSPFYYNITDIDDFHRSTIQRRIPQIIRIPDSTIFLSHRGILSQKTDEFQALPDLPEVKRTIEEAEQALAMLREQNMNLHNVMNTATTTTTTQQDTNGAATTSSFFGSNDMNTTTNNNNNNRMTVQEGMEKLEKRIASLRQENISLRNHVELLNHRLDSLTSRKSIQSVAVGQMLGALEEELVSRAAAKQRAKRGLSVDDDNSYEHHLDHEQQQGFDGEGNRYGSSSTSTVTRSAIWGDTLLSFSSAAAATKNSNNNNRYPPSIPVSREGGFRNRDGSSSRFTARPPSSSSSFSAINDKDLLIFKTAQDVLARPLPPSVMLETKAIEGLDKLKRELASRGGSAHHQHQQQKSWKK